MAADIYGLEMIGWTRRFWGACHQGWRKQNSSVFYIGSANDCKLRHGMSHLSECVFLTVIHMIFFEPDLSVTDQSRFDFNKIIEHILFVPPPTVITITATNILVKSYCSDSSRFLPYKLQSVRASGVHLYEKIVCDTIGIWLQGPEVGAIWRVYLETSEWNI